MKKKSSGMLVVMLTLSLIVVSTLAFNLYSVRAAPGWVVKTPLPELLEGAAGAVVEGKIYVLKGHNESLGDTGDVRIYDPATDSWSYGTPSLIVAAEFYQAGVVSNKIYVIGGRDTFYGNEQYDPLLDTWTSKASMPTGRAGHALAAVDDIVYVIGGRDGGAPLDGNVTNVVEAYDPATDTWSTGLAPMPTARSDITSAVVNGKIYVIGGWNGTNILSTVEVYNPSTDTWSSRTSMPAPRADLGAAECSGYIHAIGGINATLNQTSVHEIYDPAIDTWSTAEPMPTPRAELVVVNMGGTIYAIGGGIYGLSVNANEAYACMPLEHDVAVTNVVPIKTVVGQGCCTTINVTVWNQGLNTEWFGVVAPYFGGEVIPTPGQWETFWSMGDVNRDCNIDDIDGDLIGAAWGSEPGYPSWNPYADLNEDLLVDMYDLGIWKLNFGLDIWTHFRLPPSPNGTQRGVKLHPGNQDTLTFTWNTTGVAKGNYTITAYADPVPGETDTADNMLQAAVEVMVVMFGDLNGDGIVDISDISAVARCYGAEKGDPTYNANYDINDDNIIDISDISAVARHYGETEP